MTECNMMLNHVHSNPAMLKLKSTHIHNRREPSACKCFLLSWKR